MVGELIWLVTRCRPDIMYAVALMSTLITLKVMRMAYQVWGYLAGGSMSEGLVFRGEGEDLMVYTDASFGEEEAHGCVVVKWGEDPLVWRSSRQGMLNTSTAEAELVEVMEGAVTTEALRVMVEEVIGGPVRCWQFTDSSSALTIIIGDTASWRTRHLRKRARFLRWKAVRGDVLMRHQPGAEMVADMGTKPLSAVKMKEHKLRLGMSIQEPEEKTKKNQQQKDQWKPREEGGRLKLALLMAMIARGKAEEDHEETAKGGREFESVMIIYTMLVVVVTLMVQKLQRYLTSQIPKEVEKEELPLKRPSCLDEFEDHSVEEPECGLTLSGKKEEEKKQIEEGKGLEKRTVEETVRDIAPRSSQGDPNPAKKQDLKGRRTSY